MAKVDIKRLFDAGAHFGHKTSRWNSGMATYIHSERDGIHILNLEKTVDLLEGALKVLAENAAGGKQALFVGTKRQVKPVVQHIADETGQPYVIERWLGGMLTNSSTMNDRVKHLVKLEEQMASGQLESRYSKLEVQKFGEEIEKLNKNFGGVKSMNGNPGVVVVMDAVTNELACREAKRLGIPVIAVCDSNADPSLVDYVIPCNDDAVQALSIVAEYMIEAIKGAKTKAKATKGEEK